MECSGHRGGERSSAWSVESNLARLETRHQGLKYSATPVRPLTVFLGGTAEADVGEDKVAISRRGASGDCGQSLVQIGLTVNR